MTKKQEIQLFEEKKVRTVWDDELEKWFFCVVDVVEVLAESKDPKSYIKKMKQCDPELSKGWGQIVTPLSVQTAGGPQRMNCAEREGVFRIIQAILHLLSNPSRVMGIAKRDGIGRYAVSLRAICLFSDSNMPFL